jgi:hypothetical protein
MNILSPPEREAYIASPLARGYEYHAPQQLLILFLALLLGNNLSRARQCLDEILLRPTEVLHNLFSEMAMLRLLPEIIKALPENRGTTGKYAWNLLNEFLNKSSREYRATIFDSPPPAKPRLIAFDYSPDIDSSVTVDCFIRKRWWEGNLGTREHEMGPKFASAFRHGGWQSNLYEPNAADLGHSLASHGPDGGNIALIDCQAVLFADPDSAAAVRFLEQARSRYMLTIGILFDPWRIDAAEALAKYSNYLDFVWTASAGSLDKLRPLHRCREILFPFPWGVDRVVTDGLRGAAADSGRFYFSGSIEEANAPRVFWKSLLSLVDNIVFANSNHENDGLPAMASYLSYLERLARSQNHLNFSLRFNGERIMTGRAMEVVAIGRTLLQERADDLHCYLIPAEHYFEFANFETLLGSIESIVMNGALAAEMAHAGTAFFESRYSDRKLVEHLSAVLA